MKVFQVATIIGVVVGGAFCAPHAQASCGGISLSGGFGLTVSGTSPQTGQVKYLTGLLIFGSNCSVSGNITGGMDGTVSYATPVTGNFVGTGDGTISITFTPNGTNTPQTYAVGYSGNAKEALGIESDGSFVASIELQAQKTSGTYSNSALKGTYATVCKSEGAGYSDLNYVTFDGKGNLSGLDYYNDGGNQGAGTPYTGNFKVASNGTVSGALYGDFSSFTYAGVIDNSLGEFRFIYITTAGAITNCTGKAV